MSRKAVRGYKALRSRATYDAQNYACYGTKFISQAKASREELDTLVTKVLLAASRMVRCQRVDGYAAIMKGKLEVALWCLEQHAPKIVQPPRK